MNARIAESISLLRLAAKATAKAILPVFLLTIAWSQQAPAASFEEGVQLYQGRQYAAALNKFNDAARSAPSNPLLHYYIGLSYQGMNQMSLAKREYEWVAASGTPTLQNQARMALAGLSKYKSTWTSSNGPVSSGGRPRVASATVPADSGGGLNVNGRLRIIEFSADY